jgi:hypothetical protein
VLLNVTHLIDDLFAMPLPMGVRVGRRGADGAVPRDRRLRRGARLAGSRGRVHGARGRVGAVLIGQGLLYWAVLSVSQIASLFPDLLARITVGLSIAQAIPVGAAAVIGTRRLLPPLPEETEAGRSDVPA